MKDISWIGASALGVIVLLVILLTLPTMWLWNYVMPNVFGLTKISFLETMALLVLAEIFFKGNSSNSINSK